MSREWRLYLADMEACCARIAEYTAKLGREDFERNRLVYDATLRNLELLGEAARQVPEDIRAKAPEVPWRKIVAVRNILIHGYFGIDNDIIRDIVTSEVTTNMRKQRQFASVWDAIEDTPRKAASMRARSELLMALQERVKIKNKIQVEAARILGVTQPRMSDLACGRIHLFSLDVLMDMATIAGLSPHIAFKRPKALKKRTPAEAQAFG